MTTVLFFSIPLSAEEVDSLVLCKNNKTVRTLRVEREDDRCHAIYTKQGVDSVIGSGQNTASCEDFVQGVRKNLEEARWSCREAKEARSSSIQSTEGMAQ